MVSHKLPGQNHVLAVAAVLALLALPSLWAETGAPAYSLSADAAAGMTLASDGFDVTDADAAAIWTLSANFLHRIEAPGWGFVLSHDLDLSGQATSSMAFSPAVTVYAAYARLDVGDWGQLFVGKRRMGLGIGTTFAPGDLVDPRTGFWDQKNGFRGVDVAINLGPDVALRGAMSLERNFDAYAAGARARSAAATAAQPPTDPSAADQALATEAAYSAALDGATGPADPRLITWALSTDIQLGVLQLAAACVYSGGDEDAARRPSLGLSLDLGGLILQTEAAVELAGEAVWYGTAGARYTWTGEAMSLSVSVDYDYNGAAGATLKHSHYVLPSLSYTLDEVLNLYARALVELEAPSALLGLGLTLYPVQGFDLEFTGSFAIGKAGDEFLRPGINTFPGDGMAYNSDRPGRARAFLKKETDDVDHHA